PQPGPGRPRVTAKQRRGVRTRERVLDAALGCFTDRGVYHATIEGLAARARASVGRHYPHIRRGGRLPGGLHPGGRPLPARRGRSRSRAGGGGAGGGRQRGARAGVEALVRAYLRWVAANRDAARFIYAAAQTEFLARSAGELAAFKQGLVAPFFAWIRPHVER